MGSAARPVWLVDDVGQGVTKIMLKGRLVPAALPHTQGEGQGKDPKVKNDPQRARSGGRVHDVMRW